MCDSWFMNLVWEDCPMPPPGDRTLPGHHLHLPQPVLRKNLCLRHLQLDWGKRRYYAPLLQDRWSSEVFCPRIMIFEVFGQIHHFPLNVRFLPPPAPVPPGESCLFDYWFAKQHKKLASKGILVSLCVWNSMPQCYATPRESPESKERIGRSLIAII